MLGSRFIFVFRVYKVSFASESLGRVLTFPVSHFQPVSVIFSALCVLAHAPTLLLQPFSTPVRQVFVPIGKLCSFILAMLTFFAVVFVQIRTLTYPCLHISNPSERFSGLSLAPLRNFVLPGEDFRSFWGFLMVSDRFSGILQSFSSLLHACMRARCIQVGSSSAPPHHFCTVLGKFGGFGSGGSIPTVLVHISHMHTISHFAWHASVPTSYVCPVIKAVRPNYATSRISSI